MVRYLKYIVLIFGSIGLLVAGFFYYQNRVDLHTALDYENRFEIEYLKKNCPAEFKTYLYPCLRNVFKDYLKRVSLTGTNIGLKMVFSAMDDIKQEQTLYKYQKHLEFRATLDYIDINNMALSNAYQRYFGIENMYGGFISSLGKYYPEAYKFSENLILGLKSADGLESLGDEGIRKKFTERLQKLENDFYRIKKEVEAFVEQKSLELNDA